MSDTFEVLAERPNGVIPNRKTSPLSIAVADTATTGGAVRFPLNGESPHKVRMRLDSFCRFRDLRLHMRTRDGICTAWAEPRQPKA